MLVKTNSEHYELQAGPARPTLVPDTPYSDIWRFSVCTHSQHAAMHALCTPATSHIGSMPMITSALPAVLICAGALVAFVCYVRRRAHVVRWRRLQSAAMYSGRDSECEARSPYATPPAPAPRYLLPFPPDPHAAGSAALRSAATNTGSHTLRSESAQTAALHCAAVTGAPYATPSRPPTPAGSTVTVTLPLASSSGGTRPPLSRREIAFLRSEDTTDIPSHHARSLYPGLSLGSTSPRSSGQESAFSRGGQKAPVVSFVEADASCAQQNSGFEAASLHLPHALTARGSLLGTPSIFSEGHLPFVPTIGPRPDPGSPCMLRAVHADPGSALPMAMMPPELGSNATMHNSGCGTPADGQGAKDRVSGDPQRRESAGFHEALVRVLEGSGMGDEWPATEAADLEPVLHAEVHAYGNACVRMGGGLPSLQSAGAAAASPVAVAAAGAGGSREAGVALVRKEVQEAVVRLQGAMHEDDPEEAPDEVQLFGVLGVGGFGTVYRGAFPHVCARVSQHAQHAQHVCGWTHRLPSSTLASPRGPRKKPRVHSNV